MPTGLRLATASHCGQRIYELTLLIREKTPRGSTPLGKCRCQFISSATFRGSAASLPPLSQGPTFSLNKTITPRADSRKDQSRFPSRRSIDDRMRRPLNLPDAKSHPAFRCSGVIAAARAFPPRATAAGSLPGSSGVGSRSSTSPGVISTMRLAHTFRSRGRFGRLSAVLAI